VIEVRPTFTTLAYRLTMSPTITGFLKTNELTAMVATRPLARRMAGMLPAISTCDITQPPKMSPFEFASAGIGTRRRVGSLSVGRQTGESGAVADMTSFYVPVHSKLNREWIIFLR